MLCHASIPEAALHRQIHRLFSPIADFNAADHPPGDPQGNALRAVRASASDPWVADIVSHFEAANRRHDEMLAHSPWFRL
jgi:hypothetical protein